MSKREWAVIGRTFGPFRVESVTEARKLVIDIGDKAVQYDGEVAIYHKVDGEWKEYERC